MARRPSHRSAKCHRHELRQAGVVGGDGHAVGQRHPNRRDSAPQLRWRGEDRPEVERRRPLLSDSSRSPTFVVSMSTTASERSPSRPRSVTSDALSSSPIMGLPGHRHDETTAPPAMSSPPLPRVRGCGAKYPLPTRARQGFQRACLAREPAPPAPTGLRRAPVPQRVRGRCRTIRYREIDAATRTSVDASAERLVSVSARRSVRAFVALFCVCAHACGTGPLSSAKDLYRCALNAESERRRLGETAAPRYIPIADCVLTAG